MTPAEKLAKDKAKAKPKKAVQRSPRFWCRLKSVRSGLGLTLSDVANSTGLSKPGIVLVERGCDTKLSTALILAQFYGLEVSKIWEPVRASDD